jgi:hypothetical protein
MKKPVGLATLLIGSVIATSSLAEEKEVHRVVTALDKSSKSVILFAADF